jgi:flagellar biosynthesis regulator FlaF
LKFQTAGFTFGQTGQARQTFNATPPPLPFFSYQFSVVRVQDAEQRVERTIAALDASLRAELVKARVIEPPEYSATVFDVFYRDLKSGLLDEAVRAELRRRTIIPIAHQYI